MADDRIIAVCEGGPLDGQCFSVLLNEGGSPEPLLSRMEVTGVLYIPDEPIQLEDEHAAGFLRIYYDEHGNEKAKEGIEHHLALKYKVASDRELQAALAQYVLKEEQ